MPKEEWVELSGGRRIKKKDFDNLAPWVLATPVVGFALIFVLFIMAGGA